MDLVRHLRFFVAVADEGHFGRAAAALDMTQPPLSQGLRRLEQHLGVDLIHRTRQGAVLTSAGIQLLPRARLLVDDADRLHAESQRIANSRGAIHWGATAALPDAIVTACVTALRARTSSVTTATGSGGRAAAEGRTARADQQGGTAGTSRRDAAATADPSAISPASDATDGQHVTASGGAGATGGTSSGPRGRAPAGSGGPASRSGNALAGTATGGAGATADAGSAAGGAGAAGFGAGCDSGATISTTIGTTVELVNEVRAGVCDFAVVEHPALVDGVEAGPVVKLPRWVVVPGDHRSAGAERPTFPMLAGLAFAGPPRAANPPAFDTVVDLLRERGLDVPVEVARDDRTLFAAVAAGTSFGLTATPPSGTPGVAWLRLAPQAIALRLRVIRRPEAAAHADVIDRVLYRERLR
ncbi:hypothetical protein Ntsu_53040 [Nocardia sp. IFM 10818]